MRIKKWETKRLERKPEPSGIALIIIELRCLVIYAIEDNSSQVDILLI
jgi:hypothetical protein